MFSGHIRTLLGFVVVGSQRTLQVAQQLLLRGLLQLTCSERGNFLAGGASGQPYQKSTFQESRDFTRFDKNEPGTTWEASEASSALSFQGGPSFNRRLRFLACPSAACPREGGSRGRRFQLGDRSVGWAHDTSLFPRSHRQGEVCLFWVGDFISPEDVPPSWPSASSFRTLQSGPFICAMLGVTVQGPHALVLAQHAWRGALPPHQRACHGPLTAPGC